MNKEQQDLYRMLGYRGAMPGPEPEEPATAARALGGEVAGFVAPAAAPPAQRGLPALADGADMPPLDMDGLGMMMVRFQEAPDEVRARVRAAWDEELSDEVLTGAIQEAMEMLAEPSAAMRALEASGIRARSASPMPPEFAFAGMDLEEIPIDPTNTKFETVADAARWVLFTGPWVVSQPFSAKAEFRWHRDHPSGFVYTMPEPEPDAPLEIALLADFGTGLYHSRYIAKQLRTRAKPYRYVIHLGDVYYAGRQSEFDENFKPFLDPLLDRSGVFTLNSNHEMYSLGKPYFKYMEERRGASGLQEQEGSYFCLRSGRFQIVGIDTAYFGNGRHARAELNEWLSRVLREGRASGRTNILLGADHPYDYGSEELTALLDKDLRDIVIGERLVDLWFWGNVHYCALYDRSDALPFIGSCIGHGGYPYTRKKAGEKAPTRVAFVETAGRFPDWTGLRPDRGNNGYCAMALSADGSIELNYIDWMSRERCVASLSPRDGDTPMKLASVTTY